MIHLHLFTIVSLVIFSLVGILIPIHDKIKSFSWVYFENRNTYQKKSKVIYKIIMLLCIVGATLVTLKPIFNKTFIIVSQPFVNSLIVLGLNFIGILAIMVVGAYVGRELSKLLDNK
jgi:hypothetical protein